MYTTSSTSLEYIFCKWCLDYKSSISFNYQIFDRGLLLTLNDKYEQIFYKRYNNYASCILAEQNCAKLLKIFFIKAKKFEQIRLWKSSNFYRVFYLDEMNLNNIHFEILDSIVIDNFRVTLLLRQFNTYDNNWPGHKILKYISSALHVSKIIKNILFDSTKHCLNNTHCRKIYTLKSNRNSYIQININHLVYNGWNVPHCLYGGISFYEWDPAPKMNMYIKENSETLTLCDNYTNINSEHFEREIKLYWMLGI